MSDVEIDISEEDAPEIEVEEDVKEDEEPTEVCAVNPSSTDIPYETRVLMMQDEEENWVIIWAECAV